MVITLYTESVIGRVRSVSHREAASISDPDERYLAEAGSEKTGDVGRCLKESIGRLSGRIGRFLRPETREEADNAGALPDKVTYRLVLSERRAAGKAAPLEEAMDAYLAEDTLAGYYRTVGLAALSARHAAAAAEAAAWIDRLLYAKRPPIL